MKLIKGWNKGIIHPLTFIYLGLSYFTCCTHEYIATLIFVLLHEMGHLFMACCFHYQINQVKVLPFGAFLSLDDYGYHFVYEDIMVVCGGLFVSLLMMFICYFTGYEFFYTINRAIFIFNLLPIYPLDGAKLALLLMSYFLDYLSCLKMQIKFSLLTLCICFVLTHELGKMVVLSYLLIQNIDYLKNYRYVYIQTILHDKMKKRKYKINRKVTYYRPYQNFYLFETKSYSFDEMKFYLIKSMKKR